MKISYTTLQTYFTEPLPPLEAVADAFTLHTFEIDGIVDGVLDVKVLPNRAGDCGTEVGIARQLSAILDQPLKSEFEDVEKGTTQIRTTLSQINGTLGSDFLPEEVEGVFSRLHFGIEKEGNVFVITPPADRTDLTIPVDIAEEVGQILGYDRVPAVELPPSTIPVDQARYRGVERMKDELVEQGYTEVSTQTFATHGDIELANPLDKSKPFLRTSLEENLNTALDVAKKYAVLLYAPSDKLKLFEVGTVFTKEGEHMELCTVPSGASVIEGDLSKINLADYGKDYTLVVHKLGRYKPFSLYPFITRDIALWAPRETATDQIESVIRENAGELLVRLNLFDRFDPPAGGEWRVSYGYRLVFQSLDRTLTDTEVGTVMEKVSSALTAKGFEIR